METSGVGILLPILESMQSQLAAAQRLHTLLHQQLGDFEVQGHLAQVNDHLTRAIRCLESSHLQAAAEVSPTIPWIAEPPPERLQSNGALISLRERGEILGRAFAGM